MMTKRNYVSPVARYFGIGSMVLLLLSCSEQPNQPFENTKASENKRSKESIEGKLQSVANRDKATADLIKAMKETKMALKESEILLREAKPGMDSDRPIKALERELQAAESLLKDVWKTIEQGDYLKAKGQIHEITDRTNQVNQQIKHAIRKQERAG